MNDSEPTAALLRVSFSMMRSSWSCDLAAECSAGIGQPATRRREGCCENIKDRISSKSECAIAHDVRHFRTRCEFPWPDGVHRIRNRCNRRYSCAAANSIMQNVPTAEGDVTN